MSVKKQKERLRVIYKTIALFLISCFLMMAAVWVYQRVHQYSVIHTNLQEFADLENEDLRTKIFGSVSNSAFSVAKGCLALKDADELKICQDKVRYLLATPIGEQGLYSVDSLHFVKREGETLYILNWSGELVVDYVGDSFVQEKLFYTSDYADRKYTVVRTQVPPADTSFTSYVNLFSHNCKYFNLYDYHSCQVTITVPLDETSDGYLVTMMPLTEEETSFWWPLFYPVFLMNTLMFEPQTVGEGAFWIIVGLTLAFYCVPIGVTWLYWKKNRS